MINAPVSPGPSPALRPRARLAHEKEARRQAILQAAARGFEAQGFAALKLTQIASAASLAKGTIYLYFNIKEEIFLELAEAELLGWFEALDEGLRRQGEGLFPEPMGAATLTALVSDSLEAQPLLPRLLAILPTVLEPQVDRLVALRFREFLADRSLRTGRLLEQRLPFLEAGAGPALLLRILGLVLGLWPLCEPPPQVRALLDAPGLQVLDVPFRPLFESTLSALLAGLAARRGKAP